MVIGSGTRIEWETMLIRVEECSDICQSDFMGNVKLTPNQVYMKCPQGKKVSIRKLAHSQKTKTEKFFVEVGRIGTSIRRTQKERVAVPAATPIDTVMTGMRTFRII